MSLPWEPGWWRSETHIRKMRLARIDAYKHAVGKARRRRRFWSAFETFVVFFVGVVLFVAIGVLVVAWRSR